MAKEPLLTIENLSAGYDRKPVLSDVNFSAEPGETVCVIGPNGAGKSTLLLAAAGLLKPMGGAVFLSGRNLSDLSAGQRARTVAAMFTDRRQREPKTVRELVAEGRYPYTSRLGALDEKDWAVVKDAMKKTDLLSLSGRDIGELSDGQRQRAYIARAIAQEPDLLILDEPTGFLDVRYQLEIIEALKSLCHNNEKPVTILMTLHDLALLPKIADQVLMLKEGRQVGYGAAGEMLTAEKLADLFDIPEEEAAVYLPGRFYNPLEYTNVSLQFSKDIVQIGQDSALTVLKGRKHLRYGFTTGTAAALAAKGAAELLLGLRTEGAGGGKISLLTPKGIEVSVLPERLDCPQADCAVCSARKDAGDDPDATDGILITAEVRKKASDGVSTFRANGERSDTEQTNHEHSGNQTVNRVEIHGGSGIGRVTKPGLDQPVGAAAINSVPRRMISEACEEVMRAAGYEDGLSVTISAEGGEAIAAKTMNPVLGIEGGISIIGTTGIVEPMSEKALVDTIAVALKQAAAEQDVSVPAAAVEHNVAADREATDACAMAAENGPDDTGKKSAGRGKKRVILTPGNYGEEYIEKTGIGALGIPVVQVSNFIGDALDLCAEYGFTDVLLVGHAGKLIKLAGGLMNTHSQYGDCRMEILSSYAAMAGATADTVREIMDCATTDAATDVLTEAGLFEEVAGRVTAAVDARLQRKAAGDFTIGAVIFSKVHGLFGITDGAKKFLEKNGFHGNLNLLPDSTGKAIK